MLYFKGNGLKRKQIYETIKHQQTLEGMKAAAISFFPRNMSNEFQVFWRSFTRKFLQSQRKRDRFEKDHVCWLEDYAILPSSDLSQTGRQAKGFDECSDRSKRRRTEEIRSNYSANQLCYAAQMSMRASHNCNAANLIEHAMDLNNNSTQITPEKALSILVKAKLTKSSYAVIREPVKDRYEIETNEFKVNY